MLSMYLTVTSHKGGVGKTVSAVHLAAYLTRRYGEGSTVLVDGDPNRSALEWGSRGRLPFEVVSHLQAPKAVGNYEHVVIDTQGRPSKRDLEDIVEGCDLLVLPSTPDALSLQALVLTLDELGELGISDEYRVLLTAVPPWPTKSGNQARKQLASMGVPLFTSHIRRREAFQKAANEGVPVYEVDDRRGARQGWDDYVRVGDEVIEVV